MITKGLRCYTFYIICLRKISDLKNNNYLFMEVTKLPSIAHAICGPERIMHVLN
jgi:hypothetical protein